jgi:2-C-methyl-D-erythritol 2,4-cyclodiphosphate synthase
MRVGFGYDVHAFAEGRRLVLGGVEIPHSHGLLGHSDADVLLHAISDALLGAAALGDIGRHFPDTDPAYAGISSLVLLRRVAKLVRGKGYTVQNLDTTVVAQQPRLAAYIAPMVANISEALDLDPDQVNVKATTTEKLGFAGRSEGIAAYAVVLLDRAPSP